MNVGPFTIRQDTRALSEDMWGSNVWCIERDFRDWGNATGATRRTFAPRFACADASFASRNKPLRGVFPNTLDPC